MMSTQFRHVLSRSIKFNLIKPNVRWAMVKPGLRKSNFDNYFKYPLMVSVK